MSSPSPITYQQSNVTLNQSQGGYQYLQQDPFLNLQSPNYSLPFPNSSGLVKLQPRMVNFQSTSLGNSTHIYTSPLYSDIIALAKYFADWSCAYKIAEGPVHTITVEIPWDTISGEDFTVSDYVSENWELTPTQDTKNLIYAGLLANSFTSPAVAGNLVILPPVLQAGVQKAFDNKFAYITIPTGSTVPSASYLPFAQQTLDYMRFGVEGVPSYTHTLTRTAIIDARNSNGAFNTAVDISHQEFSANTGTINFLLSTPYLLRNYSIPETVGKLMNPSYSKIYSISTYTPSPTPYKVYSAWLITPPTFTFLTKNKIQLTQRFLWNEWLERLYFINSNPADFPLVNNMITVPNNKS